MRSETYLFLILEVTPESRVKFVHSKGIFLSSPNGSLLLSVLRRCFWCNSYLMLFGVCVSCPILHF